MQIGIDVTSLIYDRGVSRYTANLVRSLLKFTDVDVSVSGISWRQYHKLVQQVDRLEVGRSLRQRALRHLPVELVTKLWQVGLLSIKKQLPLIDLFHSWDWLQPPDQHLPLVSTIHDLAILRFPETAHPRVLAAHERAWRILREREAHIIAVSQSTRRDILDKLDFPAHQVHVVHEALPEEVVWVAERTDEKKYQTLKEKLNLSRPFLFFVGTREPRKNLKRLIQAWQPLSQEIDLLIAGEVGWNGLKQHQAHLRFLGKVTDAELMVLYTEASAFVYPSLYEGFGLPILESFYFGTPVVTSNNSGMLEVAGNAAELVDPLEVESIRQGIETVLHEDKQAEAVRRQRMVIRSQMFSLKQMALETKKVYQLALNDDEKRLSSQTENRH